MLISLAMIVKNEEEKLARCLSSVKEHVDEIVVVDTGSTDRTKEIAASFGAKIFNYVWCKDFSKARNYSIEKTSGDLVMVLDADNVLLKFDKNAVLNQMQGRHVLGLGEIINVYTQNGVKITDRSFAGAVFQRDARYVGPIHEQIDASLPRIILPISIFHDGYDHRDESKFQRNIGILLSTLEKGEDPYLRYKLAQEYRGLNDFDRAEKQFAAAYERALSDSRYFPNVVVEYMKTLIQLRKYEKALDIVKCNEGLFRDFPEFHFTCGELFMEAVLYSPKTYIQYFPKIKDAYERCINIGENPNYQGVIGTGSFMALHNLGAFYEVMGDMQSARRHYQRAGEMGYLPSQNRLKAFAKA